MTAALQHDGINITWVLSGEGDIWELTHEMVDTNEVKRIGESDGVSRKLSLHEGFLSIVTWRGVTLKSPLVPLSTSSGQAL